MRTLNKLIFTKLRGRTVSVLVSEKRVLQIEAALEEDAEQLGTIYIGKVKNVVKNLNAAFVEYRPGVNGYYSLAENPIHMFSDGRRQAVPLKSGDEILVQTARAAVKTKDAVLTADFSLTGRYVVLTPGSRKLGISSKIRDKKWREEIKSCWENRERKDFGLIVRTNAYGVSPEMVWSEAEALYERFLKICSDAGYRTCYSILYKAEGFAVRAAMDANILETEEIITDIPKIYEELSAAGFSPSNSFNSTIPLRLYEDSSYPLAALYHLETSLDRALSKTVWLKSGGYLVVEPTEAMTVIDVNTGKNVDKKSAADTYLKTNLEAAEEIAAQLRLRNLSGIIIIDFIDMEKAEHNSELLRRFGRALSYDPVKTVLVDMTALGLVEVTRKKIKQPLHEQFLTSFSKKTVDIGKT